MPGRRYGPHTLWRRGWSEVPNGQGTERARVKQPGKKRRDERYIQEASAKLEAVAEAKEATLHNVALAYVMQKAPYVFPLVGTRTLKHLKDAVEGLKVNLSDDDIHQIDQAGPFDPRFPHTFLSGSLWGGKPSVPNGGKDVWLTNILGTFDYVNLSGPIRPKA